MNMMALEILRRQSAKVGLPFLLISEVESCDNLPNNANAIGGLRAGKAADDSIGVFLDFISENPNTMLLVAADSDAGGLQVFSPAPASNNRVTTSTGNPTGIGFNIGFPLDGIEGQNTSPVCGCARRLRQRDRLCHRLGRHK
jgi:alkaline phosphatase